MHNADEQAWGRSDLQQEIEIENVEDYRSDRQRPTIEILIRHPDLSEGISVGPWDLSGPLEFILETLQASVPELLIALEARIPKARRAALPFTDIWGPIPLKELAFFGLVPDSELWG